MTATVTERITALDILRETRDIFAKTHWTHGKLYTIDSSGKKRFCMVGGLCHVFADKQIPEWVEENNLHPTFYASEFKRLEGNRWGDISALLEAEFQLARTIDPHIPESATPSEVEETIVEWNDGPAREEWFARGDASYVIQAMDETIARLEEEQKV